MKLSLEKSNELIKEYNKKKDFGVIDGYVRKIYSHEQAEKVIEFCHIHGRLLPYEIIKKIK